MTTDLSNFDKRCSDAHFVCFLFYYYCMSKIRNLEYLHFYNVKTAFWSIISEHHCTVPPLYDIFVPFPQLLFMYLWYEIGTRYVCSAASHLDVKGKKSSTVLLPVATNHLSIKERWNKRDTTSLSTLTFLLQKAFCSIHIGARNFMKSYLNFCTLITSLKVS